MRPFFNFRMKSDAKSLTSSELNHLLSMLQVIDIGCTIQVPNIFFAQAAICSPKEFF